MDLFEAEQQIYHNAIKIVNDVGKGAPFDFGEYAALAKEYGVLLKQLRRTTRFADRTTIDLYESNLDLTGKVHYDELTGIYNRRFMEERLKLLIKSLSPVGGILSVIILDVDFFKQYNDTYGHDAGDTCLKAIAETLSEHIRRDDDFIARYGGEEFVVVLPRTDELGARVVADKLLESVIARGILHEKSEAADRVTISIGVTTAVTEHAHKAADYIKRADEALYMSKQNGRNRYTYLKFGEAAE